MPLLLTCSKGHTWETPDNSQTLYSAALCPICAEAVPLSDPRPTDTAPGLHGTVKAHPGPRARAAAAPPADLVPGYEIFGELGRGGMGVVYKARQVRADRLVALKMILSGQFASDSERQRFHIEATAAARLHHPNIVLVYEVGECAGRPYFSMEYCPNGSLAQRLAGSSVTPVEAARITELLARAVAEAHKLGIVHRDLKPGNVLLAFDGSPKIADFGMAKRLDSDVVHTSTGAVIGTPSYMAPEQAEGKPRQIGPAADVYALGAMLYEMLTGRPPFRADSVIDTLVQVRYHEPTAPRSLRAGVPRDLEVVCLKCLEKKPHDRYASATELADELQRFQAGVPIRACSAGRVRRSVKWVRRNPTVAVLLSIILLLAGAAGGLYLKYANNSDTEPVAQQNGDPREAAPQKAAAPKIEEPVTFAQMTIPVSVLVRPDKVRERQYFNEEHLFEPGIPVLHDRGKELLGHAANWLKSSKVKGSAVVVATFADPRNGGLKPYEAKSLTQKQSDAVAQYLRDKGVHKLSFWSRREIKPMGYGYEPSPVSEPEPLPLGRVEIVLFTPQP